jgi:hypothetical protein
LTVLPGQTVTIKDAAAYGFILMQGYGTINGRPLETPGPDPLRPAHAATSTSSAEVRREGRVVTIVNLAKSDPLVMLKHFGPDNPDLKL